MRVGRCLPVNYKIGCTNDVSDLVKRRCEGKRSCVISLPDKELHLRNKKCAQELKTYLEVDYKCGYCELCCVHIDVLYRDKQTDRPLWTV